MSKDLEDSTEKLLGSQRKGSQLNAAKESKDIFEIPKKQNTQTNFDKRCQSLITKQTKVFIDMVIYWHGLEHFSPLMSDLTRIKHKEMVWSAKTRKSHPNDQKPKKSQEGSHGMRQTKAKNRSPKTWATALRNRSTKHDPSRKRQGSTQSCNGKAPVPPERGKGSTQPMREHAKAQTPPKCLTSHNMHNSPWVQHSNCQIPLDKCSTWMPTPPQSMLCNECCAEGVRETFRHTKIWSSSDRHVCFINRNWI